MNPKIEKNKNNTKYIEKGGNPNEKHK